ncbi:hypothetical protein BMF89_21270 [Arthrobacter sp. SRS-W-1-2016]|uniref:hypothetical protein n=1 Tax=Arthrobacter sp. SRS-W-1-2016 TaxID=1930254 RepID=UPI0009910485|nr:hypothetical protein [Arthrobacter sp. SRS-W-1-2016]OOP59263.1 hypothetical protein BMF89_21270 [Arthrobacter sp. SRS-W-1-2016]
MTTTAETTELAVGLPENLLACVKCGRPMRPRGVTTAEMPGTVATGHSGMCKSDAQPHGPGDRTKQPAPAKETAVIAEAARSRRKAAQGIRHANTVAGLDSFMAARHKRLRGGLFATEVRVVGRRAA